MQCSYQIHIQAKLHNVQYSWSTYLLAPAVVEVEAGGTGGRTPYPIPAPDKGAGITEGA